MAKVKAKKKKKKAIMIIDKDINVVRNKMEYISRDSAAKVLCMACGNAACDPFECSFYKEMEDIPPTDVAEVVRCKDCKRAQHDDLFGSLWCDGYHVDADFYCANGKRRADND